MKSLTRHRLTPRWPCGATAEALRLDEAITRELNGKYDPTPISYAGYARRFGRIQPRDHLVDVVVAAAAALSKAVLVTEDLISMGRWRDQLRRLNRPLILQGPSG